MIDKNVVWHEGHISKEQRSLLKRHESYILWFTGLSGSGKSTIANALEVKLYELNFHTYLLDGDNVRHGLNADLGFDEDSRVENIRRIGEISKLFIDSGTIILSAFISPFSRDRKQVRTLVKDGKFIEIFVDTSLKTCEQRDPKGIYKKARDGEIKNFTGISSPYEKPIQPELHLKTDYQTVEESVNQILDFLKINGYLNA